MSLALLLALSLCVSLGSVALAGPLYDSEYLDWDDYDYTEYQEDNEESQDLFERSSQLISKIFSKFYK